MDVRSFTKVPPKMVHQGTVAVWWLVEPRELYEATEGGFLELVSEFEIKGGEMVHPHQHPTHEFYYVTHGRGVMKVGDEEQEVGQGDLIRIPPNAVHSMWPVSKSAPIHCFCFAVAIKNAPPIDYTSH